VDGSLHKPVSVECIGRCNDR